MGDLHRGLVLVPPRPDPDLAGRGILGLRLAGRVEQLDQQGEDLSAASDELGDVAVFPLDHDIGLGSQRQLDCGFHGLVDRIEVVFVDRQGVHVASEVAAHVPQQLVALAQLRSRGWQVPFDGCEVELAQRLLDLVGVATLLAEDGDPEQILRPLGEGPALLDQALCRTLEALLDRAGELADDRLGALGE